MPAKRSSSALDAYFEFGLACRRDEPQPFDRFHRHNEAELVFIEQGASTYLFSWGRERWAAGEEALFWGAMPHQVVAVEPGTVTHWLTVPLTWFLAWQLPAGVGTRVLEGGVVRRAAANSAESLARFQRWEADLASEDPERRRVVVLEAEACFRRMGLAGGGVSSAKVAAPAAEVGVGGAGVERAAPQARPASGDTEAGTAEATRAATGLSPGPLAKVEAMTQFIAREYQRPVRVGEIAAAAGLHPEYATTLFRRACGRSLMEYLTEQRISHAQRLLATSDRKILDIALASGFRTLSRFYAAFEAHCGCAPREYRARVRPNRS